MKKKPNLAPPWVLFADKGKPVAILPAMRPGEVCSVEGYTLDEAGAIVDAANAAHWAHYERKLKALETDVAAACKELKAAFEEAVTGDEP